MEDKVITLDSKADEIENKYNTVYNKLTDKWQLMDDDFDLWDLNEEEFDSHKTAINVCTPDPRNFADDVQSSMSRAERQIFVRMAEPEVKGELEETSQLERLFTFSLEKADQLLARKLLPPLRDAVIWYGLLRGSRDARCLVYKDGDEVIFDLMPWDPRWVCYVVGAHGLVWAAYKTFRTADSILDEYGIMPKQGLMQQFTKVIPWVSEKDTFQVVDYWGIPNRKKPNEILNAVVSGSTYLKKPEIHELPSVPVIIRPVAVRPPIVPVVTGSRSNKMPSISAGYGESIYAPNRATYELINKLYSIEATRANLLSKQPMINYWKDGGIQDIKDTILQAEAMINLPDEYNRIEPMPMKEIPMTFLDMISKMELKREHGEIPHLDIGKPPPSGTLYSLVQEQAAKTYVPQLKNLSLFYSDICHLIEEQLIAGGISVDVETEAKKSYFKEKVTPVKLKRPHIIRVEFTDRSPWMELQTAQIAEMLQRQGVPQKYIWEYVYKFPDPEGLSDMAAVEIAEHSPTLMRLQAIRTMLSQGRQDEARALMEELYNEYRQQQLPEGQMTQQQSPPVESPMAEVTSA